MAAVKPPVPPVISVGSLGSLSASRVPPPPLRRVAVPVPAPSSVVGQPGMTPARSTPPVVRNPAVLGKAPAPPRVEAGIEEPPMDLDDGDFPTAKVAHAPVYQPTPGVRSTGREGSGSSRPKPADAIDRSFASGALAQMVGAVYSELGGDAPSRQRALVEMTGMLSQALSQLPVHGSAFAATGVLSLVTQAWRDGQRENARSGSLSGDFLGMLQVLQDGVRLAQEGLRGVPPSTGGAESLIQSAMLQASAKMVEAIVDPRCRAGGAACVFGAASVPALAAKFQRPIFEASYLALERLERESDAGSLASAIVSMATLVASDYVHRAKALLASGDSADISSFDEKVFLPSIRSASQALGLTLEHASRLFDTFCQSDPQAARPRF